jgi:hypothetical protein
LAKSFPTITQTFIAAPKFPVRTLLLQQHNFLLIFFYFVGEAFLVHRSKSGIIFCYMKAKWGLDRCGHVAAIGGGGYPRPLRSVVPFQKAGIGKL